MTLCHICALVAPQIPVGMDVICFHRGLVSQHGFNHADAGRVRIGLPLSKGRPSVVRPMGMIGLCKRLSSDRGSNTLGRVQLAGAGVRAGCGECRVWSASGPWSAAGPGGDGRSCDGYQALSASIDPYDRAIISYQKL